MEFRKEVEQAIWKYKKDHNINLSTDLSEESVIAIFMSMEKPAKEHNQPSNFFAEQEEREQMGSSTQSIDLLGDSSDLLNKTRMNRDSYPKTKDSPKIVEDELRSLDKHNKVESSLPLYKESTSEILITFAKVLFDNNDSNTIKALVHVHMKMQGLK